MSKQDKPKRKSYCVRVQEGLPEMARLHGLDVSAIIEDALDKRIKKKQEEEGSQ